MSIDRIATAQQSQYFLSQIENASGALNTTQQQIASGDNATTYAGFGTQTQVLQATISANARNSAYQTATSLAVTQADIQDTQLTACRAWQPSSTAPSRPRSPPMILPP
jgi:flagellar hook-associated protein 3 FlgL